MMLRFPFPALAVETGNEAETKMETSNDKPRIREGKQETDWKQENGQKWKRSTLKNGLRFQRSSNHQPRKALLSAVELRAMFDAKNWDRNAAPAVRDRLVAEGRHHACSQAALKCRRVRRCTSPGGSVEQ